MAANTVNLASPDELFENIYDIQWLDIDRNAKTISEQALNHAALWSDIFDSTKIWFYLFSIAFQTPCGALNIVFWAT